VTPAFWQEARIFPDQPATDPSEKQPRAYDLSLCHSDAGWYFIIRGGAVHFIRLLRSDNIELRREAWRQLRQDERIKGKIYFDPAKRPSEQLSVIEQLRTTVDP
jgi:hypothetical protein